MVIGRVQVEILYLICQMTSVDHVIGGSCNFMSERYSLFFSTLPSFVATDIWDSGDMMVLVCHMISQGHVNKGIMRLLRLP